MLGVSGFLCDVVDLKGMLLKLAVYRFGPLTKRNLAATKATINAGAVRMYDSRCTRKQRSREEYTWNQPGILIHSQKYHDYLRSHSRIQL